MGTRAATTLCFAVSFLQIALCQDVPGQGLQCYHCDFGQPCAELSSLVTCKEGEICTITKALSEYKVHDSIVARGCLLPAKCNSQDKIDHLSRPFRVTYSCCNRNYCNNRTSGAAPVPLAHCLLLFGATFLAILSAALV